MSAAVSMRGISVRFGRVQALDAVDLEVEKGTLHAVVGENGAGKTTLMRVLYGAQRPQSGTMALDGEARAFRSSREAIRAGVGMVSQHYGILGELDCLQNLMLGAEPGSVLNLRQARERAQALAEQMGFTFDWSAPAETLSPAAAQKLEILKLLWKDARVMILDEPTAMLSPADAEGLFQNLHELAGQGATILLVTHRIPEVMDHCRRVTVLRGGKKVADREVAATNPAELAELIVGKAVGPPPALVSAARPEPLLKVEGLTVRGDRGQEALKAVGFEVCAGEVVGVAGVDGSGQRELVQALMGVRPAAAGTIRLGGEDLTRANPRKRIEAGLRLIPEDRHDEGVIEEWSLAENAALGLQRTDWFAQGPWRRKGAALAEAGRIAERFHTKHGGLSLPMKSLSGGNQQRFVAARALGFGGKLIVAFQPARGLDIQGTREVYAALRQACAEEGAGVLVVSFDLDELLEHCDRIVAMNRGVLASPPPGQNRDREAIGRLMVGAA